MIAIRQIIRLVAFACLASQAGATENSRQMTSPNQVPEILERSDWHGIRAAYEAGRHAVQPVEGGWQARNPGQRWTTRFDGRGCLATPREGDWTWGLELTTYGFGERQREVGGSPGLRTDSQRLTCRWDDVLEEWYVNDRLGFWGMQSRTGSFASPLLKDRVGFTSRSELTSSRLVARWSPRDVSHFQSKNHDPRYAHQS